MLRREPKAEELRYRCPKCKQPCELWITGETLFCDWCDVSFFPPIEDVVDKEGRI